MKRTWMVSAALRGGARARREGARGLGLVLALGVATTLGGCSPSSGAGGTHAIAMAGPVAPPTARTGAGLEPAAGGASSSTATAPTPSEASGGGKAPPGSSFPPPNVEPPHAKTAAEGDGVWRPLDDGARDGRPVMARMRFHNHKTFPHKFLEVIAMDRTATDLAFVVGDREPKAPSVPRERRPGVVPKADHEALLAVFNGGFLQRHGRWGMMYERDVYTPPKADACTIARHRDGRLRIGTWASLGLGDDVAWYRQTPPCLVEGGQIPASLARDSKSIVWGRAIGGNVEIRRSALAFDASGRTLYYVFSESNDAYEFAQALVHLGVTDAALLDVNWQYTRFYLYDRVAGAPPRVRETVVPKLDLQRGRYVEHPADRDFFYVVGRR